LTSIIHNVHISLITTSHNYQISSNSKQQLAVARLAVIVISAS